LEASKHDIHFASTLWELRSDIKLATDLAPMFLIICILKNS